MLVATLVKYSNDMDLTETQKKNMT